MITGERAFNEATAPYSPGDGNGWPGEVAAMGHVSGVIPDAVWQQIALGGDIVTELEGAGGAIDYLRLLDGAAAGLAPPASVPADTTLPMTIDGNPVLRPGSTIRRQSPTSYLVIDPIDDGYVWGVAPGATTGTARLSGIIAGRTGALEAQVFYADNGAIVQDWTTVIADVTGLSGPLQINFPAPLMTGWGHIRLRTSGEPDQITEIRSRVGVGYKILVIGQSQTGIWLRSSQRGDIAGDALYQTVSVGRWRDQGDNQTDPRIDWVGSEAQDGLVAMAAQLRRYTDAPIMILVDAVEGSGPRELMDDTLNARRTFADLQQPLGRWGNDVSVAALNWITTGWESVSAPVYSADDMLQALILGTGPAWDAIVAHRGGTAGLHHLSEALRPGFGVAVSPGTRASNQDYEPRRSDQIRRAHALSFTVGPPVSDYRIVAGGGPHPDNAFEGNRRFGMRLAEAVARALGFSASENPHFTGAAWGATQAEIVLSVALPNGGSLTSPAGAALSSFEVNEGGGWTGTGFTAALSGNTVTLTRDTGIWAAGTRVRYLPGGAQRAGGDAVTEAAIIAGMLYETWPGDTLGTGLPVMGSRQAGQWLPEFEVEVV